MKTLPVGSDASLLSKASLFAPLPVPVLQHVLAAGEIRAYEAGEVMFDVGDPSDDAFVIASGLVEICRNDPETAAPRVVAYLGEGDSAGEMVLFTGSPRSSLARVPEHAEVFAISRAGIIELCRQEPDLALYFCRLFASRLESWVKKGRRQETQRQLQGNLNYFDLATILQTLADTNASGTLVIRSELGKVTAEIDFADGKLRFARLGHLRGEHAFYQLFEPPPSGTFLFQGGIHIDAAVDGAVPSIEAGVMGMLMEAMRLQDEWQNVRAQFADRSRVFIPSVNELVWEDDATIVPAFNIWSYLHKDLSLAALLTEVPYCEATVLTVLDTLSRTGQIR